MPETTTTEILRERTTCRACGCGELRPVLDLGLQALTGVFPESPGASVPAGPLQLVRCARGGLVQLRHTYDPGAMYGDNYGYRSGLNASMVRHLTRKARCLERVAALEPGDVTVDLGSNDATLLKAYATGGLRRIGVDPTGLKFRGHYGDDIELIPEFFPAASLAPLAGEVKLVTSIAMFYDLEDPVAFARAVAELLAPQGIWHLEQSYLPSMLQQNAFDTVCHEHLEYYSLRSLLRILAAAGLEAIDASLNDTNGGSFAVTAARRGSGRPVNRPLLSWLQEREEALGLETEAPYTAFRARTSAVRRELVSLVRALRRDGRRVGALGASTKGNVLLQYCDFSAEDIEAIGEVNEDKFGRFTPGTGIPIVPEEEVRGWADFLLVLPWHFRAGFLEREGEFLAAGGRLIFPLPRVEVV